AGHPVGVDEDDSAPTADRDQVGGVAPVDDDGIGRAVAGGATDRSGQDQADPGHAGAGQVVDGHGVGAAEGVDGDGLDAAQVHGDAADVAGEPDARAVGREVEPLRGVRPVEHQPVQAGAAVDGVAAVARAPQEGVEARAADQVVVPGAAVHGQLDHAGGQARGVHRVGAAEGVDEERVQDPVGVGDVDLGRQPQHVRCTDAGADDVDVVVPVAPVDDDGIGLTVAGGTADHSREIQVDLVYAGARHVAHRDDV